MSSSKNPRKVRKNPPAPPRPDDPPAIPEQQPNRTSALADGLLQASRDGDISPKEYARQMQEITQGD